MIRGVFGASLIGALSVGLSGAGRAENFVSGNQLYAACTVERSSGAVYFVEEERCRSYVVGVIDMALAFRGAAGKSPCLPKSVNQGQMADIIRQYLRDNPALRAEPAAGLIVSAISNAFPNCRN